jgi:hypothetical protein
MNYRFFHRRGAEDAKILNVDFFRLAELYRERKKKLRNLLKISDVENADFNSQKREL